MKSLLRSIRMKLLNEGKLLRYLTYAIGEIVLIVVGILFALKVNDWSEERKAQQELDAYVLQLKSDLHTVIALNREAVDYMNRQVEDGVSVLAFLRESDGSDEALNQFESSLNTLGRYQGLELKVGLLGELISGKTDIISRDPDLYKTTMDMVSGLVRGQSVLEHVLLNINDHRNDLISYFGPRHGAVSGMGLVYDLEQLKTSKEFQYLVQHILRRLASAGGGIRNATSRMEAYLEVLEEYK